MKVRRSGTNNSNWDGAAGLKRPRQTNQTLQLIHIIGEAVMKVTKDHLSKSHTHTCEHTHTHTINIIHTHAHALSPARSLAHPQAHKLTPTLAH